jgi:hypothetical protein
MDKNAIEIQSIESLPEYRSDAAAIESLGEARLKDIGEKCRLRLEQLKLDRQQSNWEEDKKKDFESYHLTPPRKQLPYAGYPNLACPFGRIGTDVFHANVMFTFCGNGGRFTVLPEFLSKSHMDVAERAAKYLTYVLNYESDFYDALDKADTDANKYKVGYLEPVYVKEEVWETRFVTREEAVPEIDEMTGEVTKKMVKRRKKERVKKTIFDGVKIRRIPPECIYASPFIETVRDAVKMDYLFKVSPQYFRNIEEMSKGEHPFYKPSAVKKLKDVKSGEIRTQFENAKQAFDGVDVYRKLDLTPIELAEAHFHEDINGDGLAEKVTVVFETLTGIVLRVSFSECRIVKLCPRPVDGRWDGESVRQAIQSLIMEWEAIHNQRVAKGQWSTLPFMLYKAGGRFNPQTITLMPGKGYPVDDPSSAVFPQMPGPGMEYFNEEKLLMDLIDRVLALGDAMQGVVGRGDSTATETIHAQQRAGIRLATPINRVANALNELVGHIWELNRQCAPEIKEFKVVGMGNGQPVFEKITSQDYDAMVSFKLNMATMYDVQMLRDSALLNYQTFMSNPLFMNNPAAFYQLTKETMRAVGLDVPLPKPEQANARSPFVEHDMIRAGKDLEPVLGEDTQEHLDAHEAFMRSEEYEAWPDEAKQRLILHRDKTMIQQQMLRAGNLNASGIFEGPNPMAGAGSPGLTATRNPSQTFNNMRSSETPKSQAQQPGNGMKGAGY